MQFQKPPALEPGDKVAVVSLSWGGPGTIPLRYEAGKQQFQEEFNLTVVEMPNALKDRDWVQRNPKARAEDLLQAFSDNSIKAVISSIGGDDSVRTLPFMDYDLLRQNPKAFIGYSDSTVTNFALLHAGLVSFYGPSMMAGFAEACGMHRYLVDSFRDALFRREAPRDLLPNTEGWTVEHLDWGDPANRTRRRTLTPCSGWNWIQGCGSIDGTLIGGCVEVVDWLRGTPVWPTAAVWDGAILFLETSEDAIPPIAFERILRAIGATGALDRISALLIGRPGGTVPPETFAEYDRAAKTVINNELGRRDLPIVTGMDFGHTDPIMTLPMGVRARVDCDLQRVTILESAVI